MNISRSLLPAIAAMCLAGCALDRISHFQKTVTLTTDSPTMQLGKYNVSLVSIAEDGTTSIRVVQTQQTLTARLGESYVSHEFGTRGLTLDSASRATGTATFTLRSVVHR